LFSASGIREVSAVTDQSPTRPKNVVMVDADNPLVEVRGEFFWREDHDRMVAAAREAAYRQGYRDAWAAASRSSGTQQIVLKTRPPLLVRIVRRGVLLILLAVFLFSVVAVAIDSVLSRF